MFISGIFRWCRVKSWGTEKLDVVAPLNDNIFAFPGAIILNGVTAAKTGTMDDWTPVIWRDLGILHRSTMRKHEPTILRMYRIEVVRPLQDTVNQPNYHLFALLFRAIFGGRHLKPGLVLLQSQRLKESCACWDHDSSMCFQSKHQDNFEIQTQVDRWSL